MSTDRIKVWDPLVRLFHWSLVATFFIAYFIEPEDGGLAVHVWAGYFVGGIVVLRVVWGFIGTPHARFADFAFGPFHALRYLGGLLRGRAPRHLGHSPAGAWMVYALLLTLAATVYTGMSVLAMDQHAGPLAPLYTHPVPPETASIRPGVQANTASTDDEDEGSERGSASGEELVEATHEVLANIALVLVALHILGVLAASIVHRENLALAMVTGLKRRDRPDTRD